LRAIWPEVCRVLNAAPIFCWNWCAESQVSHRWLGIGDPFEGVDASENTVGLNRSLDFSSGSLNNFSWSDLKGSSALILFMKFRSINSQSSTKYQAFGRPPEPLILSISLTWQSFSNCCFSVSVATLYSWWAYQTSNW
jgi:hypothetical protein